MEVKIVLALFAFVCIILTVMRRKTIREIEIAKPMQPKSVRIGTDGKAQRYVGLWLDANDYVSLSCIASRNNRSIAGEIRNRILETTTTTAS